MRRLIAALLCGLALAQPIEATEFGLPDERGRPALVTHYYETYITTSGASSWQAPPWADGNSWFEAEIIGDGGGGAGSVTTSATIASSGGGSGGVCKLAVQGLVAARQKYVYSIGAGGTAGTSAPTAGGNGTGTTLTIGANTYTAGGGTGGVVGSGSVGNMLTPGGTASGPCTNPTAGGVGWGRGDSAVSVENSSGGTVLPFGVGGMINVNSVGTNGVTGTGCGSGGSGGAGAVSKTGAVGQPGCIHIVMKGY